MSFTNYALEQYVAPGISEFTNAEVSDMSTYHDESKHWVANLFLNSVFLGSYKPPFNAYLFNFFRRAEAAFREHDLARTSTLEFLSKRTSRSYAMALFHWEIFLGQSWHAFMLLQKPLNIPKRGYFKPGDGSLEERLNYFYGCMKHVENSIDNGEIKDGATVPVWLTNDGLITVNKTLSYADTAEILKEIAKWADVFANPSESHKKLGELIDKEAPLMPEDK